MTARAIALATAIVVLAAAAPALAHVSFEGASPFVNGILHPLIVPAHILIAIALGLWIARHDDRRAVRLSVVAFAGALAVGLSAAGTVSISPLIALCMALVAGLLAASAWRAPGWSAAALTTAAAFSIGLESGTDDIGALIGTWIGAQIIFLGVAAFALRLDAPWLRIGARVIGAWSAAIALLMLALAAKAAP